MNYVCPMHPEVTSDKPGRCPKCGMALVVSDNAATPMPPMEDKGLGTLTLRSYLPLFTIILIILVASGAASWNNLSALKFIAYFMTGFFLVFAGFKLMDLSGFAHGYFTYDLLAKRMMAYGYAYPFIELSFGLSMLAGYMPIWLLWTEFAVMLFSGIGVSIKVAKREQFQCVCLGTFLKVPLTKVTLVEDFGMALLALVLIWLI
ncbi:MAG: heavy metal-binding domain-containing protein [Candidatus Paceibacterota bacterium]